MCINQQSPPFRRPPGSQPVQLSRLSWAFIALSCCSDTWPMSRSWLLLSMCCPLVSLILGIASGERPDEYPVLDQPFDDRGERFRESFEYIRSMVHESPAFDSVFSSSSGGMDLLPTSPSVANCRCCCSSLEAASKILSGSRRTETAGCSIQRTWPSKPRRSAVGEIALSRQVGPLSPP